ncbi:MAG TPA: hypothetical protein DHV57_09925 [Hyphomonas sp.]|nr:hypothetical protein [Hyphomonas sp.]HCJ17720.1 hypothetical protein [Hyphomonas sp.]
MIFHTAAAIHPILPSRVPERDARIIRPVRFLKPAMAHAARVNRTSLRTIAVCGATKSEFSDWLDHRAAGQAYCASQYAKGQSVSFE